MSHENSNSIQNTEPLAGQQKLYREKEVSALLGISLVTIWRLRKKGEISYRRISGTVRYSTSDIAEFVERSKCPRRDVVELSTATVAATKRKDKPR